MQRLQRLAPRVYHQRMSSLAAALLLSTACITAPPVGPRLRPESGSLHGALRPPHDWTSVAPGRSGLPAAAERASDCDALIRSLFWPGLGQLCDGKTAEGATLAGLAAVETGLVLWGYLEEGRPSGEGIEHPAALLPLVALQDLWVYGLADSYLERQRRQGLPLVPQEDLWDLAVAPFDPQVMSRPSVWLGTLGTVAAALGFAHFTDDSFNLRRGNLRPTLFRREYGPATGYALGTAVGTATFTHVAVAEEAIFRGVVQSSAARDYGPWGGWALGSLVFGLTHLGNLLVIEPGERMEYATIDVPFITAVGSYLGLTYLWEDYSLAAPVAIHFWYDVLISLAFLAFDRDGSLFQVGFGLPW